MAGNFCGIFFFSADWRIFLVLRELIFAIRTDWFFSLGINFGKYLAEVHARETRFFYSHEASTQIDLEQSSSVYNV